MSVLLNMDPGAPPVVVTASEGDIGRIFTFQLIKDGMPCSYPSATVTAEILKSDGHGTSIPCAWSGSEVVMVTTEQSTIRAGKASCELRIVSDSYNIGTANFILAVEPRPINADTDQTDSSYSQTGDPGDVWTLGSNGVPSWSPSGLDATAATAGQAPIADGAGGWQWGDVEAGDSVPTEVRQAIFNLLDNNAFANDDAYTADLAVLASWATEVTSITVSPTILNINGMTQETIVATTQPSGGIVTWTSSDPTIATVSGGVVTPTGVNGTCTITASCGGKSATCAVTVSGFATLLSIDAVYTQSGAVYATDTLNSLKSDLVVTANYDDDRSVPVTGYTLSGTLTIGTSTITVAYGGKTTTFNVTVSAEPIDTNVEISQYDKRATYSAGATTPEKANYVNATNCGVTKTYDMDSLATIFYPAGILPYEGTTLQNSASLFALDSEGVYVVHINEYLNTGRWAQLASDTLSEFKLRASKGYEYSKIFMNVDTRHLDDSYMYDFATGQVWFAGENTPLYGMANLSQIVTGINAVYTQNHRVYPDTDLSLLAQDLVVSLTCTDGVTRDMDSDLCTLSGTLSVGTSTVTVAWKHFTTTFNVTVTAGSDTSPDIAVYDCIRVHRSAGYFDEEKTNGAITILYAMDAPTTDLSPAGIIPTSGTSVIADAGASIVVYDGTQTPFSYANEYNRWAQDASGTMTEFTQTWTLTKEYSYIAFTLDKRYLNTAYMYDKTTGQVWFAGRDTPYYGMSNISEAT